MSKTEIVLYGLFAMFGGLLKYGKQAVSGQQDFNPGKLKSWVVLVVELMTSFFVGMLVLFFSESYGFDKYLSFGLAGVAGHFGGSCFDLARKVIEQKLGLKKDE